MTTIYLIRHAEAEGNLYRIAQGQANSSITDRGERQIQALARRFADIPIDAVYASDLYRTCATASAIYKPQGCAIRLLLAALQGIPLEELGKTPTGSNTAVSLLRAEGARIQVVWRDDASHLTDPAFTQGCTVKQRANGLEPGLYFRPLAREQAEFPAAWAGTSGALSAGAPVLAGYLDGTPVGAVAFDDGRESERGCGWIPLLAVAEPWRRRGYGVQLIGQAVMHYRPMGRDRLRLPTPETEAAAGFYREFGFSPAADGPAWEKFIGYDPEFLGT